MQCPPPDVGFACPGFRPTEFKPQEVERLTPIRVFASDVLILVS